METRDHWKLAKRMCRIYEPIHAQEKAFSMGNVMPNVMLHTYIKSHRKAKRFDACKAQIERVLEKKSLNEKDAYRLGVATHYLADCFTYPHNAFFNGTMVEHLAYEKQLRGVIARELETAAPLPPIPGSVSSVLERLHEDYSSEGHGTETDARYILKAVGTVCSKVAATCAAAAQKVPVTGGKGKKHAHVGLSM